MGSNPTWGIGEYGVIGNVSGFQPEVLSSILSTRIRSSEMKIYAIVHNWYDYSNQQENSDVHEKLFVKIEDARKEVDKLTSSFDDAKEDDHFSIEEYELIE